MFHGPGRARSTAALARNDIVITTYGTLSADAANSRLLAKVKWLRVVLDEAHSVRNASTKQARAAVALQAKRRWAVTGTPLQNRLPDIHGLMYFLCLRPLNDKSMWKRCVDRPMRQLDSRGLLTVKVGGRASS